MQKNKVGPLPNTHTKINSKWIKDLNVTPKTKRLEENMGQKLHDTAFGNDLLDITPKAQVAATTTTTK